MQFDAGITEATSERSHVALGQSAWAAFLAQTHLQSVAVPSAEGTACFDDDELVSPGSPTGRVLLLLDELDPKAPGVYWVKVLAAAFNSRVEVCPVDARTPPSRTLGRRGCDGFEPPRRGQAPATLEALRWCSSILPEALVLNRVISVGDDYVTDAASLARQRSIDWIVISARGPDCGVRTAAVARATGRPVLVARPPTTRPTLLIATDSHTDNFPVLHRAAQLMSALQAPAIAFHDTHDGRSDDLLLPDMEVLLEPWQRIQSQRPSAFGRRMPAIDLRLGHAHDRAGSILAQARLEDAGMILIGLPGADADLAPVAGSGDAIPRVVVDRAARSVLLVPPEVAKNRFPCECTLPQRGFEARGVSAILADRRRWRVSDFGRRRPFAARRRRGSSQVRSGHDSFESRLLAGGRVAARAERTLRHAKYCAGPPRPMLRRRRRV